jgi:TPP-dependent 2-oxoacid decarboxylase
MIMKIREIVEKLDLKVRCGADHLDREVTGGFAGDMLSNVIAQSKSGNVWLTMQVHVNIVAVAVLKELAAIILVQGKEPAEDTLKKALEEKVTIIVSDLPAFETAGKLYGLGIGNG